MFFKILSFSLICISSLFQTSVAFAPHQHPFNNAIETTEAHDRRSFISTIVGDTIKTAASASILTDILTANPLIANANDKLSLFQDTNVGFQFQIPTNWKRSEQSLPDRRRLVLFVNDDGEAEKGLEDLIFIAYTPVRDDFTSLSSFGSVEQVCERDF